LLLSPQRQQFVVVAVAALAGASFQFPGDDMLVIIANTLQPVDAAGFSVQTLN